LHNKQIIKKAATMIGNLTCTAANETRA